MWRRFSFLAATRTVKCLAEETESGIETAIQRPNPILQLRRLFGQFEMV